MAVIIPIMGLAFLDAIAIGEDYHATDYNELVGGSKFTGYDAFPLWEGRQFPDGMSHAAGRYQFEPATWQDQQAKLGLPDFSPASQDVAAWDLAQADYARRTKRQLMHDLTTPRFGFIVEGLRLTWTSVSNNTKLYFLGSLTARRMLAAPVAIA